MTNVKKLAGDDPRLDAIIERIRRGAKLLEESKQLGINHNGPLRAALRQRLGREAYDQLIRASVNSRSSKVATLSGGAS